MERELFQGVCVYTLNTLIVGTGAAGYNMADELWNRGQRDVAIITEHRLAGTSRNTGSDKQTYYKLTLGGGEPDSVEEMARTLFEGGCVDGEHALCEAALSAPCFLKLAGLGVEFPQNRYGEYVGYKTDHDPRRRATSAGPYTSRQMTEVLEESVHRKGIPVLEHMQAISLVGDGEQVYGLLCLNTQPETDHERFVLFCCKNLVMATGGPAGMYRDSVYPQGHYGATGLMLAAGAKGKNLTEWQFGLASVRPRWNVSGTYMQALPRIYSIDPAEDGDGPREQEFLSDFFQNEGELLSKVFLKGYQWPFDVRKVAGGSSVIDILVYLEQEKGRRIFLDYRSNPGGKPVDFSRLEPEAREYLERAGACFGTPYERLLHMNAPAVEFYRDKGVDLASEPLEIALCAQHNNGGIGVDAWWQTSLKGLFCIGEAAATHGVYRPGGSALNAGQVGGARAARYIAACRGGSPDLETFRQRAGAALDKARELAAKARDSAAGALESAAGTLESAAGALDKGAKSSGNVKVLWEEAARNMSLYGGAIREYQALKRTREQVKEMWNSLSENAVVRTSGELSWLFRLDGMLACQYGYLGAMLDYLEQGGKSRGSALYTDAGGTRPYEALPDCFRFSLADPSCADKVQETVYEEASGEYRFCWRQVHPMPQEDDFFENVWREYRKHGNVY